MIINENFKNLSNWDVNECLMTHSTAKGQIIALPPGCYSGTMRYTKKRIKERIVLLIGLLPLNSEELNFIVKFNDLYRITVGDGDLNSIKLEKMSIQDGKRKWETVKKEPLESPIIPNSSIKIRVDNSDSLEKSPERKVDVSLIYPPVSAGNPEVNDPHSFPPFEISLLGFNESEIDISLELIDADMSGEVKIELSQLKGFYPPF